MNLQLREFQTNSDIQMLERESAESSFVCALSSVFFFFWHFHHYLKHYEVLQPPGRRELGFCSGALTDCLCILLPDCLGNNLHFISIFPSAWHKFIVFRVSTLPKSSNLCQSHLYKDGKINCNNRKSKMQFSFGLGAMVTYSGVKCLLFIPTFPHG